MDCWSVLIKTKKDGDSVVVLHSDVSIQDVMLRCINKYSQVKDFFFNAEKKGLIYILDGIMVQMNNDFYGWIDFTGDEYSCVTEIKIQNTSIHLLKNAFPE